MKLSGKQKLVYDLLRENNPIASQAYLGALDVLEHNNVDKIHQSANSIRHALGLITRDVKLEEPKDKDKKKDGHKKKIRKLVDPLGGLPSELDFLIRLLIDEYHDWFVEVAHYSEFPTERQYRRKFAAMEEVLLKIMRPHFDVIAEIDKILASGKPSASSFKKLEELMARDFSSYDHFFQNALSDWLPFLVKRGYFDNPKHLIKEGERFRYGFLSPSRYLTRIAEKRPTDVLRLILDHRVPPREERNPVILENFVLAATKMHSRYARKIADRVSKENWLDVLYFSRLNEFVSDLMVKLSNDGYQEDAINLARILFDVKLTDPYPKLSLLEDDMMVRDVRTVMDNYWYKHIAKSKLPILAKNNPPSLVNLLVFLLNKSIYLENVGRNQKESDYDGSVVWRPAIEDHEQNSDRDFRSVLTDILRDTLVEEGRLDINKFRKELKIVGQKQYPIFRRIEIHIYRTFPKQFKKDIECVILQHFDEWQIRHEYYHLLKETFPLLSSNTKKAFLEKVMKGPKKKLLDKWEQQAKFEQVSVDSKKKFWAVDKLEPISEFLDDTMKEYYDDILKEVGKPSLPDFHFYHSQVQTAQPVTELVDGMVVDDVINFVKSYKTKKDSDIDFPTFDGTRHKFQEYVENSPLEYSKKAQELKSAEPEIVYGLFSGLENASRKGNEIEWDAVLSLCEHVIETIGKGTYERTHGFGMPHSVVSLLEEGLKKEKARPDFSFRDRIWNILCSLARLEESKGVWEEDYPKNNTDSIGISINTMTGETFHAITAYALWCNDNLCKEKTKPVFVPEVKKLLENYFAETIPNTISRHAVLGLHFPNLLYFDRDWALQNLEKIFPSNEPVLKRAAWDGYLYNRVYIWVFKEIHKQYLDHVKEINSPKLKDGNLTHLDENLIAHITIAYLHKLEGSETLFQEILDTENDKVLSNCAWKVGTVLKDYEETPNKLLDLDAVRKIWQSKLARYGETGWWFIHSPFDKEETLDLLLDALKRTNGVMTDFVSMVEEELDAYAKEFPLKTVEVLELLFKSDKNKSEFYAVRGITTKNLLETLLKSKNRKAIDKTKSLINYLGTLGFNEFKDLLDNTKN